MGCRRWQRESQWRGPVSRETETVAIAVDDRIADLKEEPNAGNESRGKRAEKAEVIRNCCMAAMVIVSDEVRAHSFVIVRGPKRAANNAPCSDEADNVAARTQ